jgi:hypothetical protein
LIVIHALTLFFVERLSYYLTMSLQATTNKADSKTKPGHNSEQSMALFSLSFAAIVQFFLLPQSLMTSVIGSSVYSAGFVFPILACMLSVIGNRFLKPSETQLLALENELKNAIKSQRDIVDTIKALSLRSNTNHKVDQATILTPEDKTTKLELSPTRQSVFASLLNLLSLPSFS